MLNWRRAVDQESLRIVDTHFAYFGEDCWVLDAFGDRFQAAHAGNFDKTAHRSLIECIVEQIVHELPIYLEIVDREGFQIAK